MGNVVVPTAQLLHLRHLPTCVPEALLLRYQVQGLGVGHAPVNMADHQPVVVQTKFHLKMDNVVVPTAQLLHLRHLPTCVPEALLLRYQVQGLGVGHAPVNMADHRPIVVQIRHLIL